MALINSSLSDIDLLVDFLLVQASFSTNQYYFGKYNRKFEIVEKIQDGNNPKYTQYLTNNKQELVNSAVKFTELNHLNRDKLVTLLNTLSNDANNYLQINETVGGFFGAAAYHQSQLVNTSKKLLKHFEKCNLKHYYNDNKINYDSLQMDHTKLQNNITYYIRDYLNNKYTKFNSLDYDKATTRHMTKIETCLIEEKGDLFTLAQNMLKDKKCNEYYAYQYSALVDYNIVKRETTSVDEDGDELSDAIKEPLLEMVSNTIETLNKIFVILGDPFVCYMLAELTFMANDYGIKTDSNFAEIKNLLIAGACYMFDDNDEEIVKVATTIGCNYLLLTKIFDYEYDDDNTLSTMDEKLLFRKRLFDKINILINDYNSRRDSSGINNYSWYHDQLITLINKEFDILKNQHNTNNSNNSNNNSNNSNNSNNNSNNSNEIQSINLQQYFDQNNDEDDDIATDAIIKQESDGDQGNDQYDEDEDDDIATDAVIKEENDDWNDNEDQGNDQYEEDEDDDIATDGVIKQESDDWDGNEDQEYDNEPPHKKIRLC